MIDPTNIDLPPPPNPVKITEWTSEVRAIIVLASGFGLGSTWFSHITDAQISAYLTAIVTVVGLIASVSSVLWSRIEKTRTATAAHNVAVASAVASAQATAANGTPTAVVPTAPPPT